MEYLNIKNSNNKLSFEIKGDISKGLDKSIINGIRRTIISHTDTVAFEQINIVENNSSIHNEYIKQRLELIPISISPKNYKNNYLFMIHVVNDNNEPIIKITSNDFDIFPLKSDSIYKDTVTIADYDLINKVPDKVKNSIIKPFTIRDITSYILITELKNTNNTKDKQSLKLYCFPSIGTSKQHSKYNNVSQAVYTFHKDESLFDEQLKNIIKIKKIDKSELEEFKSDYYLEYSERFYHRDIYTEPYWYDFNMSSYHFDKPLTIYKKSILHIISQLQKCIENFENLLTDNDNKLFKYTKVNNSFVIKMNEFDDTIGNIIQSHVVKNIDDKSLIIVCGYRKPHPLELYIDLSLTPREKYSNDKQALNLLVVNLNNIILEIIDILNDMNSKI